MASNACASLTVSICSMVWDSPPTAAHVAAFEADAGHLADLDPGDAYLGLRLEPGSFAERRGVGGAAADERQAVGVESRQQQEQDDAGADGADDDGVALAEGLHVAAHLPVSGFGALIWTGNPTTLRSQR
jgi:hypothetical protein